ncbi:hypothetical protein MM26B8_03700 [Mycoplasmopsis meleagridis]|uniref:Lipoprotein n=1 Tax=Mycoplasmopsis meleagridis ATCC 25294 TaxID=1264554 RepID=A0A0F5H0M8_9BACT|nr:hypothetical protein [Mycoplasmopsis meleagridis]KKB26876.1 hypothetical protein MMELEA_04520 [Mycoplasmopsis meleagridis ATCC 25294]OAD18295.1 hypothetical protein MM26B8_03700 [Mycoplasmopsis meleagridis]VEU77532.1 Uncharacterised protein [Mycoplasmopsis meleagridis]
MQNKKIAKTLVSLATTAGAASAFLALSANFEGSTNSNTGVYQLNDDKKFDQVIYYVADNKYYSVENNKEINNKVWNSEFIKLQNFNNGLHFDYMEAKAQKLSDKIKYIASNANINQRTELTNPITDKWFDNPINRKPLRVIFNDINKLSSKETGFYNGSYPIQGAIYISKDLRFYGPVTVSIYTNETTPRLIDQKVLNFTQDDNGKIGSGSYFISPYRDINTYQGASQHNQWVYLNNVTYVPAYSDMTGYYLIDSNTKAPNSNLVANGITDWGYRTFKNNQNSFEERNERAQAGKYGIKSKYLSDKQNVNNPFVNSSEKDKDVRSILKKNIGSAIFFDVNTAESHPAETKYFVEVKFELTSNIGLQKSVANQKDYSSAGHSFVGLGLLNETLYHNTKNEALTSSKVFHSLRRESKNLLLITKEQTAQALKNDKISIPSYDIDVYDKQSQKVLYTIAKDKKKFNQSKSSWTTKTAAVLTNNTNFDYQNLVFKPKVADNKDKKYTIKMSKLSASTDKVFTGERGYYSSTLEWDYSDWYKFNSELNKTQWLTKGQKDALLEEFKNNLDADGVQLKENSIKNIDTYIREIKNLDITQQSYEDRYLALINYLETKNPNSEFSNKQLLLLSSKSNKTALDTLKLLDSNYANAWNKSNLTTKYDSSSDKPKDRTQNQANKIIDLGSLNNAISNLNTILSDLQSNKLDGLSNINNFYAKLDQKELTNLSKHTYNN